MGDTMRIVRSIKIPKTMTEKLLSLEVGDGMIIDKHNQACALSIITYYRKRKPGYENFRIRTKKRDADTVFVLRES